MQQFPLQIATNNPIIKTDSYKQSHFKAYDPEITRLFSYIESRGGEFDHSLWFGQNFFLKSLMATRVTTDFINEAESRVGLHGLPFNRPGWERIRDKWGGYAPLRIRALPEGTVLRTKNALMTFEGLDPDLPWVAGHYETRALSAAWYPTTVGTLSWHIKQDIRAFLDLTCDDPTSVLPFRLHDFGSRGASSAESAVIGGAAHIVNFMGSDTMEAIDALIRFYRAGMPAFSIPAAEHSTVTSFGRNREIAAYERMLSQFAGPGRIFAVVSDSYDLWNAVAQIWGNTLKQAVINNGGTLVIRPDSGDPRVIPVKVIKMLADIFGFRVNSKGYKVLPDYIRVIQGDGVNRQSINDILTSLMAEGFSAENIAFGMGGALLQAVNRDDMKFAMKASAGERNGVWENIQKDPITDPGKKSKAGRLRVIEDGGIFTTVPMTNDSEQNALGIVWEAGELHVDPLFDEVRARSEIIPPDFQHSLLAA